jgi:Aromatic-ring hydroxylase, C-terminal
MTKHRRWKPNTNPALSCSPNDLTEIRYREVARRGVPSSEYISQVDAPAAVLIRPDGYVAWTAALTDPEPSALSRWFGRGKLAS